MTSKQDLTDLTMIYENYMIEDEPYDLEAINADEVFREVENNPPHDQYSVLMDYSDEILEAAYEFAIGQDDDWYDSIAKDILNILGKNESEM